MSYLPHPEARITAYSKTAIFEDRFGEVHNGYVMFEMINKDGEQEFFKDPMNHFLKIMLK